MRDDHPTFPCYVFDLDGTLADCTHRLHYIKSDPPDWDAFFEACERDEPIQHVLAIAQLIHQTWIQQTGDNRQRVPRAVVVTGRSSQVMVKTHRWLDQNDLGGIRVYMRNAGDHRPDFQIKRDILEQMRADWLEPLMVFDDRDQVVDMWRKLGIPCAQVAEGDF